MLKIVIQHTSKYATVCTYKGSTQLNFIKIIVQYIQFIYVLLKGKICPHLPVMAEIGCSKQLKVPRSATLNRYIK